MSYRAYLRTVWIAVWCLWVAILVLAPTIAIQTLVPPLRSGAAVPWSDVIGSIAMMPFGTAIVWLVRRCFNFAACEVAKGRVDR